MIAINLLLETVIDNFATAIFLEQKSPDMSVHLT